MDIDHEMCNITHCCQVNHRLWSPDKSVDAENEISVWGVMVQVHFSFLDASRTCTVALQIEKRLIINGHYDITLHLADAFR